MSSSLGKTITDLVLENQGLRKSVAEEKAVKVTLMTWKKELEKLVRDLRKENSDLRVLLVVEKGDRKTVIVKTPSKVTFAEVRPNTPDTPVSLIAFKLGRKRGGGEGEGSGFLSRTVEVGEGKRRKVEEEVGTRVDPEKLRGTGPIVGLKVGSVAWLVGVEGVVEELGWMGIVSCEGSRWLVEDAERDWRMKEGKTLSTVVALVRGGKEVDGLFHSEM